MNEPVKTLTGLFSFLLNCDDNLTGTHLEKLIQEVCGKEKPVVYKPRSGKINGSQSFYNDQQLEYI
jgi:hypothetical protein